MHEFAIDVGNSCASFSVIPPEIQANTEVEEVEEVGKSLNDVIQKKIKAKKRFYGIEISPAASGQDLDYTKFMPQPLFTSITWLFDDNLKSESLSIAPAVRLGKAVSKCCPVLMHLTCYNLEEVKLREFLDLEFHNILALKGDLSHTNASQRWTHAIDLVREIQKLATNATIGVAGYPEVHHRAKNRTDDLQWLKAKVDAGAKFIITNTCFSFDHLVEFIRSCRAIGITVPIIPGIYVPSSYDALEKMLNICKVVVPSHQMAMFKRYKNDGEHFKTYAIENAVNLLTQIFAFDEHTIYGVHFFTLNKYEHIFEVVQKCDFANK